MNILFITSEAVPFAATGGLADVAGALPGALCKQGDECRVVMPLYSTISAELRGQMEFVASFSVPLSWRSQYCGVYTCVVNGVTYYLLDNEYYFNRPILYGQFDDGERFAFFAKAALELLQHIDFPVDVLHANDWQSAMVPVFLDLFYRQIPAYQNIKTVFTIHNIAYQGQFGSSFAFDVMGLTKHTYPLVDLDGDCNMMKGALETANAITTVSPTYAQEILDFWYAHGLHGVLGRHQGKLRGILNGIDTVSYDPATDTALHACYSAQLPEGKAHNKARLMEDMGLDTQGNPLLVGMVTRLVDHKGLDLVKAVFDDIMALGVSVVILGTGDSAYEWFFGEMTARYPGRVSFQRGFIPTMARQIYAGADVFLMPSKTEPCGLAQMISLRYGTIPVVRATGGLQDSIVDLDGENGNGYTFQSYNAHDMLATLARAAHAFEDAEGWHEKVIHALNCDFSWARSAEQYRELYQSL